MLSPPVDVAGQIATHHKLQIEPTANIDLTYTQCYSYIIVGCEKKCIRMIERTFLSCCALKVFPLAKILNSVRLSEILRLVPCIVYSGPAH